MKQPHQSVKKERASMILKVTESAAKWYKDELSIKSEAFIRFFPRYGYGGHIPGFSIGINNDKPKETFKSTTIENITFFIELEDAWYFEEIDLIVTLNEGPNEPVFSYSV